MLPQVALAFSIISHCHSGHKASTGPAALATVLVAQAARAATCGSTRGAVLGLRLCLPAAELHPCVMDLRSADSNYQKQSFRVCFRVAEAGQGLGFCGRLQWLAGPGPESVPEACGHHSLVFASMGRLVDMAGISSPCR